MKPLYTQLLSKEERLACMKMGAAMTLKEAGITAEMRKSAQVVQAINPSNVMQALAVGSLLAGIPIGTLAHVIGRQVNTDEAKVKELKEKIKYYRAATRGLETGLGDSGNAAAQDTNVT